MVEPRILLEHYISVILLFIRLDILGTPTDWQKTCFTRVLKGHINLAMAEFPAGTTGPTLDVIARMPLWAGGLDYRHGTGHGVGSFLNVHEGPHGVLIFGFVLCKMCRSVQRLEDLK